MVVNIEGFDVETVLLWWRVGHAGLFARLVECLELAALDFALSAGPGQRWRHKVLLAEYHFLPSFQDHKMPRRLFWTFWDPNEITKTLQDLCIIELIFQRLILLAAWPALVHSFHIFLAYLMTQKS